MMDMPQVKIIYVNKQEMVNTWAAPYFGFTRNYRNGTSTIFLRNDLPGNVMRSVEAHEQQHAKDRAFLDGRVWYWEVRAWWAAFRADWRGFFQGVWMSTTDRERMVLYWKRMTQGF